MEAFRELFGEKFRDVMSISNPMYPLHFERFGDANLDEDEEFKAHVRHLYSAGHQVPGELSGDEDFYTSREICEAETMARMAYAEMDRKLSVAAAREALEISPVCPEAYNVLAQFGANTYEEALGERTLYCSFDGSIVYKEKTAKQLLVAALNV